MNWNHRIRQIHRWLSITFVLFVVANFVVWGRGETARWVGLLTLLPLGLLTFSGLYRFFLPYATKWVRPKQSQIA
jgi:heme A synthase